MRLCPTYVELVDDSFNGVHYVSVNVVDGDLVFVLVECFHGSVIPPWFWVCQRRCAQFLGISKNLFPTSSIT